MYIKTNANGHTFVVALYEIIPDGMLANDTPAYTARAEFSRDGKTLGSGRWDGEGFVDAPELLPSIDDSQDTLSQLERSTRAELAKIGAAA